ncbi:MAG: bifunctional glutamate N-acetyltransferase/amino-acid acetyltransferase ArgJ, partial [Gemmatimonadota bacterium]|nr:bifunctional glutamate N-acetyltransferase/amino-acid acetyltransferase ArgJ [Gemmatimonadota bacterium]
MTERLPLLEGGSATSPKDFLAASAHAGLHPEGKSDVAVLYSETPCTCAGVFTQNRVKGWPVVYNESVLSERPGRLRGVVMNSQIANALTGPQGLDGAKQMAEAAETALEVPSRSVLVLSTGMLGEALPLSKVLPAVTKAAEKVHPDGGADAAKALMTTDRISKHAAVRFEAANGPVTIGGIAKGSTMVHPKLATVLGIITTDAKVEVQQLGHLLQTVCDRTFNAITVDGHSSPNDTVLLMANGSSEIDVARDADAWATFQAAVLQVAEELALSIVRDGSKTNRFLEITVTGAPTETAARGVGRSIGSNALVKTSFGAGRIEWGLIFAAVGDSGVPVDPERMALNVQVRSPKGGPAGEWVVVAKGGESSNPSPADLEKILESRDIAMKLDLGMGGAAATVWTN